MVSVRRLLAAAAAAGLFAGCATVDADMERLHNAVVAGNCAEAVKAAEELATDSFYSKNLGAVEAGRAHLLAGDTVAAERWFRKAVDSAVDRKEASPKIKLGDVGNEAMAATVTDDRTREYYLEPYELNLAIEYGILAQVFNGKKADALADARLSVYIQDSLAETYGADLQDVEQPKDAKAGQAGDQICERENAALKEMMAASRNSWENPALWYLSGVLFEADGDLDFAWQSYRKAAACREDNAVFAAAAARADKGRKTPASGKAKLVVIYEEGLVPIRQSVKIPIPIYTMMSIDLPVYRNESPYAPGAFAVSGKEKLVAGAPAVDIRALAARDLSERMPGVVTRNITRALLAAGAQAAVNCSTDNGYAQLAVFAANTIATAIRRADTRSWVTLPDGQQVWTEDAMPPGDYQLGINAAGANVAVPVSLKAGETHLVWIAKTGNIITYKETKL